MKTLEYKVISITGATGFLGQALIPYILKKYKPKSLRLLGRSEWKLAQIIRQYGTKTICPMICDVRDRERVFSCLKGCDLVIHAAALKRLEINAYNPQECLKTNVMGSVNVMDACLNLGVKKLVFTSSDKAVNPKNLYGYSKGIIELMIQDRGSFIPKGYPQMCITRYGNVMNSTGAVLPFFIDKIKKGEDVPLTHKGMTRFLMTIEMALDTIGRAIDFGKQGEVILPKDSCSIEIIKAIEYLKKYYHSKSKIKMIGTYSGEKLQEEIEEGVLSCDYLIGEVEFIEMLQEEGMLNG